MPGQKGHACRQAGLAPIFLVILVAAIIAALAYLVINQGILKLPFGKKETQEPAFNVKTEYQNPFRESAQNEEYVNPFDNLK